MRDFSLAAVTVAVAFALLGGAHAAVLHVPGDYGTIEGAVAAASAGDTIEVSAGEFVGAGQVVIDKDLTISGAGAGETIVKPQADPGTSWFLVNTGVNFNLRGVTLDGDGKTVRDAVTNNGTATIADCAIKDIKSAPYAGFGVWSNGLLNVYNTVFSNIEREGIRLFGTDGLSKIIGNTYYGKGVGDWLDYAVETGAGTNVLISNNRIYDCIGVAYDGSTSCAIQCYSDYPNPASSYVTITGNTLGNCSSGIAIGTYDTATDDTHATINYNDLSGVIDCALDTGSPVQVDARSNWWGTTDESAIADMIFAATAVYTEWPGRGEQGSVTMPDYSSYLPYPSTSYVFTAPGSTFNVQAGFPWILPETNYRYAITTDGTDGSEGINAGDGSGGVPIDLGIRVWRNFKAYPKVQITGTIPANGLALADGATAGSRLTIGLISQMQAERACGWYLSGMFNDGVFAGFQNYGGAYTAFPEDLASSDTTPLISFDPTKPLRYELTINNIDSTAALRADNGDGWSITTPVSFGADDSGQPGYGDDLSRAALIAQMWASDGSGSSSASFGDITVAGLPEWQLALEPTSPLYVQFNKPVTIELRQNNLGTSAVYGYQAFIGFDSSMLTMPASTLTTAPYDYTIMSTVGASTFDLAAGTSSSSGVSTAATLATLTFVSGTTEGTTQVRFRPNDPPTRFTDSNGYEILPTTIDSPLIVIDNTKPVIECPADIIQDNDTERCGAMVEVSVPAVTDNLAGVDPSDIVGTRDDGLALDAEYPVGVTTMTWTATDRAGNSESCIQTITVNDVQKPAVTAGTIDACYPTQAEAEAAAIAATSAVDNCTSADLLTKNASTTGTCSATITVTVTDDAGNFDSVSYTTRIDNTPPVLTNCPADIEVYADADTTSAQVSWAPATATDDCDEGELPVTYSVPSGSTFTVAGSPYTVICSATDSCGNTGVCSFTVAIQPYNESVIDLEMEGVVAGPIERCIEFVFGGDGDSGQFFSVSQSVAFTNGKGTVDITTLPAGHNWTCVTAKDTLHTLKRQVALTISGTRYVSSFEDHNTVARIDPGWDPALDDSLTGGDLSNDNLVDILDFGTFAGQYNPNGPIPAAPCGFVGRHADITGDGKIDGADFTFIHNHFLLRGDSACGLAVSPASASVGRTSIAVKELAGIIGMRSARKADINHDGVVDTKDMQLFVQGTKKGK